MMESSDMKNMVIKNLPSNMVEEAIIIFKENQRVKEIELIERGCNINSSETQTKSRDYILKEAEMLVTDYIKKIENNKKRPNANKDILLKYKLLKLYSVLSSVMIIVCLIIYIKHKTLYMCINISNAVNKVFFNIVLIRIFEIR